MGMGFLPPAPPLPGDFLAFFPPLLEAVDAVDDLAGVFFRFFVAGAVVVVAVDFGTSGDIFLSELASWEEEGVSSGGAFGDPSVFGGAFFFLGGLFSFFGEASFFMGGSFF